MYRRKRRNRGTWLQTLGQILDEGSESVLNGISFALPVDPTQIITHIQPLTTDAPSYQGDSATANTVMGDVIGNEYFLDRIVGKLFLHTNPGTSDSGDFLFPVLVGAGMFIARADDADVQAPIGAQAGAQEQNNYCVLEADTVREPWIWRRTWILGAGDNATYTADGIEYIGTNFAHSFPSANVYYGSVLDGPHIDAKTKRRVGQEDRLWFCCAATYIPGYGRPAVNGIIENQPITGYFDYRLHGALRRARQSGRF